MSQKTVQQWRAVVQRKMMELCKSYLEDLEDTFDGLEEQTSGRLSAEELADALREGNWTEDRDGKFMLIPAETFEELMFTVPGTGQRPTRNRRHYRQY